MGQILSNPDIRKENDKSKDVFTAYGVCCMQGWRMSMEDQHITQLSLKPSSQDALSQFDDHLAFYAVFDGHGGSSIAEFSGENVHHILAKELNALYKNKTTSDSSKKINYAKALIDCFLHTDEEILKDKILKMDHSGCTATSVLVSEKLQQIICANSGDSRTVLSTNKLAKNLSYDHKPTNAGEKARIFNAGGFVEMSRVNGNLALSRAIGDFEFKQNHDLPPHEQIVTVVPDILEHFIDYENDEFIILACDGIWDCLSSQECVDLIHYGIINENILDLCELSSKIVDVCCSPDAGGQGIGCDNMSMMIVALLQKNETLDEWFIRIKNKKHQLHKDINFANYRKKIFNYYTFNDENIFAVTNPSTYNNNISNNNSKNGFVSSGLGSLIKPKSKYEGDGDDDDDDVDDDDDDEDEDDEDGHGNGDEDEAHGKEVGKVNEDKVVLNLDDFLQQNSSLTRDENGMTYIQGHLLSEVLESLVNKKQSGSNKEVAEVISEIENSDASKDSDEKK